jgi:hypothetical protein
VNGRGPERGNYHLGQYGAFKVTASGTLSNVTMVRTNQAARIVTTLAACFAQVGIFLAMVFVRSVVSVALADPCTRPSRRKKLRTVNRLATCNSHVASTAYHWR